MSNEDKVYYSTTIILIRPKYYSPQILDTAEENNWWALSAIGLAIGTATGNILVCLAICWERRLQNVTNYFLMSLALTDLMVAILVMPLGILTLVHGFFPLPSVYCLAWICLDVLFCTASIMHLCTISVDRYLSLRYPMKFGRNKSRRRVILKIVFVWVLSIAMSLPLSLMYSQNQESLVMEGTCQIPDPLYKLIGSIICFYIPLIVMLVTYALTVRLLAMQKKKLGRPNWTSNWIDAASAPLERRHNWRRLLTVTSGGDKLSTMAATQHGLSVGSTDTQLTSLDTNELWIQESEPTPCTMSALEHFGAEMLKLSRGLQGVTADRLTENLSSVDADSKRSPQGGFAKSGSAESLTESPSSVLATSARQTRNRRISTYHEGDMPDEMPPLGFRMRKVSSFHEISVSVSADDRFSPSESSLLLPSPYPDFVTKQDEKCSLSVPKEVTISSNTNSPGKGISPTISPTRKSVSINKCELTSSDHLSSNIIETWGSRKGHRKGAGCHTKSSLLTVPGASQRTPLLRRSATLRYNGNTITLSDRTKNPSSPCLLQRYQYTSRNSSVISRNSSRHGRIIRLEQKATKVLGVVFFTFVILWAPFFILNLIPVCCSECDKYINGWVMQLVTWLGYASSMVNPIFYTIFNKVFRQAFEKVLKCRYKRATWRPHR